MRHRKKGRILDRKKAARKALLKNLASSLIIHGKIKTTLAKAKELRSLADKVVILARKNDLSSKRRLLSFFSKKIAKKAIEDLREKYKDRKSGFTRITKIDSRKGDSAEMAQIEYI